MYSIIKKEPQHDLIFNLKYVDYISSSGLRIFILIYQMMKGSGSSIKFCNLNRSIKKIFEVVDLVDIFEIFDSEEEALTSA